MATQLLYLIGSLAGVAAMVGLCVLLFGRGSACVDAASAAACLRGDIPGFRAGAFVAATDNKTGLMEDACDGALYLVTARGSGLVSRRLSRAFVRQALRDGAALNLRLADFTFPSARIAFAEEKSALDWERRFARLAA
ncbi:MAG TPA: hypothetical protein VIJ85_05615 [Rhizomicrobium sp.]